MFWLKIERLIRWIIEFYDFCFQPPPAATPPVSQNEAVTVKQEKTVSYKWRTKAFTCSTTVTCEIWAKPIWETGLWRSISNRCSELFFLLVGVSIKFICKRRGDKQISEKCGSWCETQDNRFESSHFVFYFPRVWRPRRFSDRGNVSHNADEDLAAVSQWNVSSWFESGHGTVTNEEYS